MTRALVIAALLAACGSKGSKPAAGKDAVVAAVKDAGAAAPDARPARPDEPAYLGDPYEDLALAGGTLRVTLARGTAKIPAPGVSLHLVSLDIDGVATDRTFTTDATGAFELTGLIHDGRVAYHVLGELEGDRLESAPITLRDHGMRLDLRARASGGEGMPPLPGFRDLDVEIPDGEVVISVASTSDTVVTLIELGTSASRTPTSVTPESLGSTARFAGLTPGAIYVAHVEHSSGRYVSRPLLAMSGPGVGRAVNAMAAMVRCANDLKRDRDALHGWTRCELWQTGGIPRAPTSPLILPLPEGATNHDLHASSGPAQLTAGAVTWSAPVPPGVTYVDVEYTIPVTAGRAEVALVSAQGLMQVGFHVEAGPTMQVIDVTGGQYRAPDFSEGGSQHMVWADYTRAGDRLAFTITGITPAEPCELLGVARWTADGNPAPAPDVGGESSNGGAQVRLSSLRGQPVVLNLFASWTPPSAQEVPSLIALSRVIEPLGAKLVVVASDQTWDAVTKLIDPSSGLTVWLDRPKAAEFLLGDAAHAFGTTKLPETYLIDAEGLVRYWIVNSRDWTSPDALACIQSLKTPWTGPVAAAPPPYVPPSVHLSGTLRLGNVTLPRGGVLYILARRVYDDRPVAAIRVEGPTFPQSFRMTDAELLGSDAFVGDIEVTARIDRDGDPMTKERGDVFGTALAPTGSTNVQITIDQIVP